YRGGRGISGEVRRRCGTPAPLGAGRLATAALDLWKGRRGGRHAGPAQIAADRPVENVGQSATHIVGASEYRGTASRMDVARQSRARLDRLSRIGDWRSGASANSCSSGSPL